MKSECLIRITFPCLNVRPAVGKQSSQSPSFRSRDRGRLYRTETKGVKKTSQTTKVYVCLGLPSPSHSTHAT